MVAGLSVADTCSLFRYVAERVIANKEWLTELDGATGDGDHGVGMATGFSAARDKLEQGEFASINDVFKTIGSALMSTMGGASGVVFGTLFSGGVKGVPEQQTLTPEGFADILENALQAVKARGKANVGDKTMVDALEPAVAAWRDAVKRGGSWLDASRLAEEHAKQGAETTKSLVARFGRAKSLGERSIGFPDAGAVSVSVIFQSIREWLEAFAGSAAQR